MDNEHFDENNSIEDEGSFSDNANDESIEDSCLSPREICALCLKVSFFGTQKQEFILLIKNRIPEVGSSIEHQDRIYTIFSDILDYYDSRGNFDDFWLLIKEERKKQWENFYPKWEKALKKENDNPYQQEVKNIVEQQSFQTNTVKIDDWFFQLNNSVVQSMAITAALFQGVEKNIFNEMVQDVHKRIFPPTPEVPKNELSSEESKEDSEQQKEEQVPSAPPQLENELNQFQMAGLKFILDKRNSDYGLTDVEVVIFEYNNYQTELLKLIRNNLYSKQPALFEFIGSLADDDSSEKRLFAINAVIALSETHLFQDLLGNIIRNWAKTESYYTHQATALALSGILLQRRLEHEILALLNSWLKTGTSIFLNITSMFTYYLIADKFPDQALIAIAHISEKLLTALHLSKKDKITFSRKSLDIAFRVYQNDRSTFISYLYKWIKDDRTLLRQQAAMYFFRFIDLDDAVTDQASREKIVVIIFNLWEKSNIPKHLKVQEDTTGRVESWAKEALVAWENDDFDSFESYRKLFHDLYQKYKEECQTNKTCRVNRLEYHLQRWEKRRIWELKRAEKRGVPSSKQSSFDMLRPESA
ncbi:MAG: hypothetical protein D3915_06050 [Candidatus Electrothrix sp. AU1_5]|nr:hypothetical protein [Candidatus Electrothrix gigas]